jgi:translation elongation factor EF-G
LIAIFLLAKTKRKSSEKGEVGKSAAIAKAEIAVSEMTKFSGNESEMTKGFGTAC